MKRLMLVLAIGAGALLAGSGPRRGRAAAMRPVRARDVPGPGADAASR